jgi:adenosylmethionine-8-amino-7-oxononanoate aminotransferase
MRFTRGQPEGRSGGRPAALSTYGRSIAACFVEQRRSTGVWCRQGLLSGCANLRQRHPPVFDEVICGSGTGKRCGKASTSADMITMAKALTNGARRWAVAAAKSLSHHHQ